MMMLHGNLKRGIAGTITCLIVLAMTSPPVLAAEPHEDPETARPEFSGIALFRYYSASLDFVLLKDPDEVASRLEKMPFANIPQSLQEPTDDFASSIISVAYLVAGIDRNRDKLRLLTEQSRFDEATRLAEQISDNLSRAGSELERAEQAIETTGGELAVPSAPEDSELKQSYNEVLAKINKIRGMLDLYRGLLTEPSLTAGLLKPTDITLEIRPLATFVGDSIHFEGVLTAEKKTLSGREVDILLNNSQYVTARTDANGRYQGILSIPYWYQSELELQALYYPRDKDTGLYLASLSPVVTLEVLFYGAELEMTVEDRAYPGRETTISGRFDYGQSPPPTERKVEIYIDDVFITGVIAPEAFAQKIVIAPEIDEGKHSITLSAVATGRYSPVTTTAILNVTRATPVLDLNIPRMAVIPGSVKLDGKLYSEAGPLGKASIKIRLGKSRVELVNAADGTFETKIRAGLGLGLLGGQDLKIEVLPQEPWHAPLSTTRRLLILNAVNGSGFLAVLVFLGIYLPGRLRRKLGVYPGISTRPVIAAAPPEIAPAYSENMLVPAPLEKDAPDNGEPRNRIFYRYRLVFRLVQGITRALLRPQQTLREFAEESSKILGPAAQYFIELTRMVERLLYSQYRPTEQDVESSRQLSLKIEKESKAETSALSFSKEGKQTPFKPDVTGVRVLISSPWRQLSTWLWVLLIATAAYYACLLLFLLPLLAA